MSATPQIIPIFPLPLVLFPGERMPLHIFEPRYKEMVSWCLKERHAFGVVSYLNNRISRVGCIYEITEVTNAYDDGRYDLVGQGGDRFLIHGFDTGKPYLRGGVTYFHDTVEEHSAAVDHILDEIRPLFGQILDLAREEISEHPVATPVSSFGFAHYIGFELTQKQNLLEIKSEYERLVFIKNHLELVLPKLRAFEDTKTRIRSNGHFREFPPIQFSIDPGH